MTIPSKDEHVMGGCGRCRALDIVIVEKDDEIADLTNKLAGALLAFKLRTAEHRQCNESADRGLAKVIELEAEVAKLTKYGEGMKENLMDVQDKACVGHIEEVAELKAETKRLTYEIVDLGYGLETMTAFLKERNKNANDAWAEVARLTEVCGKMVGRVAELEEILNRKLLETELFTREVAMLKDGQCIDNQYADIYKHKSEILKKEVESLTRVCGKMREALEKIARHYYYVSGLAGQEDLDWCNETAKEALAITKPLDELGQNGTASTKEEL